MVSHWNEIFSEKNHPSEKKKNKPREVQKLCIIYVNLNECSWFA